MAYDLSTVFRQNVDRSTDDLMDPILTAHRIGRREALSAFFGLETVVHLENAVIIPILGRPSPKAETPPVLKDAVELFVLAEAMADGLDESLLVLQAERKLLFP